jgi:hypothetical protein
MFVLFSSITEAFLAKHEDDELVFGDGDVVAECDADGADRWDVFSKY